MQMRSISSFIPDTTYYLTVVAFGAGEVEITESDCNDATFVISGS